jgi:uncharacterized membrane protein YccC
MGWVIQLSSPRMPFVLGAVASAVCAVAVLGRRGRPQIETIQESI